MSYGKSYPRAKGFAEPTRDGEGTDLRPGTAFSVVWHYEAERGDSDERRSDDERCTSSSDLM